MMKNAVWKYIAAGALLGVIVWTLWGNTALQVTTYTITDDRIPGSFSGFRIVQISDLHNAEYGEDNRKLISVLSGTKPDIILLTGDLIDSSRTDVESALRLCMAAVEIAPVYYVTGNHEAWTFRYDALKTGLLEMGVIILDNSKLTLTRDGEYVTMIGMEDPAFSDVSDESAARSALKELHSESDGFTILLAHRLELFDVYADSGVDLVFSGHAHGGQFRLPFVGGVVAPNQGLFPKYDAGAYHEANTSMIVSRGVGNSVIPIRFNNRPEIVVAVLK